MKKLKKGLLALGLVLLLAGTSYAGYAYWDSLQDTDAVTITLGEGYELT